MKILFLLNEGFDTPGPSNHLIETLIRDTLESGISVHMIESRRKRINDDIPDSLKGLENFSWDVIDRPVVKKSAFAARYLEEILYAVKCRKYWKKLRDIDLIFVQSGLTAWLPVYLCKKHFKKPVLYSVQDVFPGSAVSCGVLRSKRLAEVFCRLQRIAYKNSDVITVISEDMKEKVAKQGVLQEKIQTVVNWFDDRAVREIEWEENRFVRKYNLAKEKFYVQYAGTMGYVFDYNMVLETARRLKDWRDIEFQMLGEGSQKAVFEEKAGELGLDNIVFYPREPQDMVSDVYSACSVCLIPLKRGVIGNSVPSKAALLMACRRAIINSVDEDSSYFKMFNDQALGVSVSNGDPNGVAAAILALYKDKEERERLAANAYAFGARHYSRNVNTQKFVDIFQRAVRAENGFGA